MTLARQAESSPLKARKRFEYRSSRAGRQDGVARSYWCLFPKRYHYRKFLHLDTEVGLIDTLVVGHPRLHLFNRMQVRMAVCKDQEKR